MKRINWSLSFFRNGSMPRDRSALPRSVIFFPP